MPNIGKFTTLVINQRAPLIEETELRGTKTLFVRPRPNWPDASGVYPFTPMDIEVTIRNKVGAVISEDVVALPTVGMSMQLQGDGLEVFGYYSPKAGLGTPYASYDIEAGVMPGPDPSTPSRFYWTAATADAYETAYPALGTDGAVIPSFSKKMRISSTGLGFVSLVDPSSGLSHGEFYDFAQCREWVYFSPEMYRWRMLFNYPAAVTPYESFSIEFA